MGRLEVRGVMWTLGVLTLLNTRETWSLESGINRIASVKSNTTSIYNVNWEIDFDGTRNLTVNLGSEVNLTCTNKTWSEMLYTIWRIHLSSRRCLIGFSGDRGENVDTCGGGKALRNTSRGESFLQIPNFSHGDEGAYTCESVYAGGQEKLHFNVAVTVSPTVSAWLEWRGSKRVAVCLAAGGKPAASVFWRIAGNMSGEPALETLSHPDGLYTVKSSLDLPEGAAADNLSCAVTHSSWRVEETLRPEAMSAAANVWVPLLIAGVIVSVLLGFLFFIHRNLTTMRPCRWSSTKSSDEAKPPPTEEVEEVEPYASYVQRVNSIYNSSADRFT